MPLDSLTAERDALRAMLGEPAPPVYLDLKPGPLTDAERELFTRRLATVDRALLRQKRWGLQRW